MKDVLVPIDRAGRLVLPKNVREELAIKPGDLLKVTIHGAAVTLTPNREKAGLVRKGKALVFSTVGESALSTATVDDLLDAERAEHQARSGMRPSSAKRGS